MRPQAQRFLYPGRHPTLMILLTGGTCRPFGLSKVHDSLLTSNCRSKPFKVYIAILTCLALLWVNFFAAGPSAVMVEIVIDLFKAYPPNPSNPTTLTPAATGAFSSAVTKAALLFSTASLTAGMCNLMWVPLAVKCGRRPVYTFSFLVFGLCCIWSAKATSYSSLLAARIMASWFAGSAECVAPITIADMFFLHERGRMTAYVNTVPHCHDTSDA